MSRNRKRRQSIRWARHFNHYSHMDGVFVGGRSAAAAIWGGHWNYVRRQAKHRYGETS